MRQGPDLSPAGRANILYRWAYRGAACAAHAANNFAQVSLELGGKSPFIVFDDVNIESAVNGAIGAIFGAAGQSCVAGSRLYLQEGIADAFLERMTALAQNILIGDPLGRGDPDGATLHQRTAGEY